MSHFNSDPLKTLDVNAIGLSVWDNTPPAQYPEASVVIEKGLLKSGNCKTGALIRAISTCQRIGPKPLEDASSECQLRESVAKSDDPKAS